MWYVSTDTLVKRLAKLDALCEQWGSFAAEMWPECLWASEVHQRAEMLYTRVQRELIARRVIPEPPAPAPVMWDDIEF